MLTTSVGDRDVMSARLHRFHALALTALLGGLTHAGPLVSPVAGSDVVLALRAESQPELRLTYNVERPSGPAETVAFGLSTDYQYRESASNGLSITDFRLKRIFRTQKSGSFVNDSLFAEAWYRGAELDNRAHINEAMTKAGVDLAKGLLSQVPYWAETELGVISTRFARPDLHRETAKDRVSWSLKGNEVVAVRYRDEPVPVPLRRGLRRWWPSITPIHPAIADELAASGRVPAELWVSEVVHGKSLERMHWTLAEARLVESAKYPLPAGLAAMPTEGRGAYPQLFELLATTVAEKRTPVSQLTYVARAKTAISQGAGLEALLWVMEMQLAAGVQTPCSAPSDTDHCALAAQAGPLAKTDSRTAVAFAARSPDASDRAQFDSLPNAYFLHLLWATRPPGNGVKPEDSERDLIVALKASPIADFCKDAGDFYAGSWQPFAAWQVYDLGRLMSNHQSADLLGQVDKLEAAVESGMPTLF
jgi:hypothetical protein